MKLFGTVPSPYTRRIRLYGADIGAEIAFEVIDIYDEKGRETLQQKTPALKVPFLTDGDMSIYDSRVIFRYLAEKFGQPAMTWHQENTLTLIDAANDALVTLMMGKRSELDTNQDVMLFSFQHERLALVFQQLEDKAAAGEFGNWDYSSICLYCLLDWVLFRALLPLDKYPALLAFVEAEITRPGISETDPR
ncbi:MAG: glutathione S-transferase [Thalassotalea sp.]|nr:glutathione S-transferase [Thalassotalea sp.]